MGNSLVVGMGEVGNGVFKVLSATEKVFARDKASVLIGHKIDYLHIAIPYTEDFKTQVKGYMELYNPKVTIVYSTVPIGTCEELKVVHAPVEGKHPAIGLSIQNSARWLGSSDKKLLKQAKKLWEKIVPVRELPSASFTEALKLLSTTEYGVNIEFARYKKQVADSLGMDYVAMKQWNLDYNQLYKRLGMEQFRKFILDAPEGGLGGHCVLENSILLDESYPHSLVRTVYKHGKEIPGDKPYLNRTWLYAEYWGKGRSSENIGSQFGVTGTNILRIMRDRGIKRRTQVWSQSEIDTLIKLSETHTFKEIAPEVGKTYDAVRLKAIQLAIRSIYEPGKPSDETRQKISATLQGLTLDDWKEFKSSADNIIRRSDEYKEWRRAVFKRDNNTCQLCGDKSSPGRNIELHADHIKPFAVYRELRFDVDNGRVLCVPCHKKTDTYGAKTRRVK